MTEPRREGTPDIDADDCFDCGRTVHVNQTAECPYCEEVFCLPCYAGHRHEHKPPASA